ncbi:hypothetical protein [Flagellimonas baculiformis]|uniref:hypothetical protein n=1 Tax=Flagellimonas baculiformis TaxID=3067310 RepID=UPI00296EA5B9|nr:hypothetical protein [Muricauda sp. D6]
MKTKQTILLITFALVLTVLLLTSSFSAPNACAYANSNLEYIKSKIQAAVTANDLKMAKYHAYKALNGIEKTKGNFVDCGCEGTIESLEKTLSLLKTATKSEFLEDSKQALHRALENTMIGLKVLKAFEHESSSPYGNDFLTMNTKEFLDGPKWLSPPHSGTIKEQVHECLLEFEMSLGKVVSDVDCAEARRFVTNIHEEARLILLNTKLSEYKKQYHQRVKVLSQAALQKLGDCK